MVFALNLYFLIVAPTVITYWIKLIWFKEYTNDFKKMYIYSAGPFVGSIVAWLFCYFGDLTCVEVGIRVLNLPRFYSYFILIDCKTCQTADYGVNRNMVL